MTTQPARNGLHESLSSKKTPSTFDFISFEERSDIAVALADRGHFKEADRFCNCGRRIHKFTTEELGLSYGIRETCKSRICDRCAESQFRRFRESGLGIISRLKRDGKKRVSFLTLTFKTRPLTKSHIRACEKAVRRFVNIFYGRWYHKFNADTGKYRQTRNRIDCGAIAVMEIGPSRNLHFHLLVYGYFHRLENMSRTWTQITGDSYRIHISQVSQATRQSPKFAIEYILKYIRKPQRFSTPADYVDHVDLMKGVRRLHTFGVFYNNPGWAKKKEPFECPFTGARLIYRGPADPGEVLLNYFTICDELSMTRATTTLHRLLRSILATNESDQARAGPVVNPALDTRDYREPAHHKTDPVRRLWCYRSEQISLDSLI